MAQNEYTSFKVPNKPFTMSHQTYFLDRMMELKDDGFLSRELYQLLSGAVISVRNTVEPLLKDLLKFLGFGIKTREGVMTKEQLATVVEQNRHTCAHQMCRRDCRFLHII